MSSKIRRVIFLRSFLSKYDLSPFYERLTGFSGELYNNPANNSNFNNNVFFVKDIPGYLQAYPPKNLKLKTIPTVEGYLIRFDHFNTFDDYLDQSFSPKSKSNFRRYTNRLEKCFDIRYKMYYGNITKAEYHHLFDVLKDLLVRRFQQKKEANYELEHLGEFRAVLFDLIRNKKANLFVIYDKHRPISIRINMRYKNIAYYILSSYDIDYAKFHLGSIEMLKNAEWFYQQEFEAYDLLKGYGYYKKKWATHTYYCENHIIYDTKSINSRILSSFLIVSGSAYQRLIKTLKSLKLDAPYKKLKKHLFTLLHQKNSQKPTLVSINYLPIEHDSLSPIDIENDSNYSFLRKTVNDFLFITQESFDDITIYKSEKKPFYFQIRGKSNVKTLMIQ
ncbi:GNAT family N-acetyltransferase [Flagellimonas sp. 389]|uniref:GNAT family N-acetyltransferase n=1 Tax=Flagellimonas sp. 389 TaxID=2835862 RepID=UPI001BD6BBC1|nr:GNAT family N-acetyltransferase [Flagellimonas sp. 389]MBS9463883.1 GNAT family N-acetyltransferase [Flagellimonas sp. 389]